MQITVLEKDVSTKEEMIDVVFNTLQQLVVMPGPFSNVLNLWSKLVQSKRSPGEYSPSGAVSVLAYFPYASEDPPLVPCMCFVMNKEQAIATGTPCSSKLCFLTARLTLKITPPTWKLSENIAALDDPPQVCAVQAVVSGLAFAAHTDPAIIHDFYDDRRRIDVIKASVTPDISTFVDAMVTLATAMHRSQPPSKTAKIIWYDLIHSKCAPNLFSMNMPSLLRIASSKYDGLLRPGSVLVFDEATLRTFRLPSNQKNNPCIGLYSATLNMFFVEEGPVPQTRGDLWPDIQPALSALTAPPAECRVRLFLSNINFVSVVSEAEVRSMAALRSNSWWDGVRSCLQRMIHCE
jgi:hypothetical protein